MNLEFIHDSPLSPMDIYTLAMPRLFYVNHSIAREYTGGQFNLRFDDTNPVKEDTSYVDAIKEDVKWLGAHWDGEPKFASDYYHIFYESAVKLIKQGKAYVDNLTAEELNFQRGTPTRSGIESPYRNRSIDENLSLFEKMKNGEYNEGEATLRAKIDMGHVNVHMRDPIIYRIRKVAHHRTGAHWCILSNV
jgi:glutaminyl-tRNA synthetase